MFSYLYKFHTKKNVVFFVLFFSFFLSENGSSLKIKNYQKLKKDNILTVDNNNYQNKNPWEDYMKIFDIPNNHGSGVKEDLGGVAIETSTNKKFLFPYGKCPVFSKVIKHNKNLLLNYLNTEKITEKNFLLDANRGTIIPVLPKKNYRSGIQFPQVDIEEYYKKFISPIKKKNILECAEYANTLEHIIEYNENNINCATNNNKGICIKQPFIYDLKEKMCYILYTLKQNKNGLYYSSKTEDINEIQFVYGNYNIRSDWKTACPVKPIKGAVFGKWENNKCNYLKDVTNDKALHFLNDCGKRLFNKSPNDEKSKTYGEGINWATYSNDDSCMLHNEKPNCLIYDKSAYSFTSLSIINLNIYDLPPCFEPTNGWIINANCNDGIDRTYACLNGVWTADDGIAIKKCKSIYSWANISKDDESEDKEKKR